MSGKTRKIGIIVICCLLIFLIGIIIYNVVRFPSESRNSTTQDKKNSYITMQTKTLDICTPGVDCGYTTRNYDTVELSKKAPQLDSIIESLNNKIDDLYNRSLNSTDMTSIECAPVSNLYQRSIMTQSTLTIYESEDLFSFALLSSESNLCTNEYNENLDITFYDAKNDKILTENDIKTSYSITDEEIVTAVANDIAIRNAEEGLNYSTNITEYRLYIDYEGYLCIYYRQPEDNIYYTITLDKKVQ